jgi:hypothetical protein
VIESPPPARGCARVVVASRRRAGGCESGRSPLASGERSGGSAGHDPGGAFAGAAGSPRRRGPNRAPRASGADEGSRRSAPDHAGRAPRGARRLRVPVPVRSSEDPLPASGRACTASAHGDSSRALPSNGRASKALASRALASERTPGPPASALVAPRLAEKAPAAARRRASAKSTLRDRRPRGDRPRVTAARNSAAFPPRRCSMRTNLARAAPKKRPHAAATSQVPRSSGPRVTERAPFGPLPALRAAHPSRRPGAVPNRTTCASR